LFEGTDVVDPHWFQQCESGSGSRVSMTKIYAEKNILTLYLHKGRQKYWRILHPSKDNIQHLKLDISSLLLVIFVLLDPDPDPADQNECGSGSTKLETLQHSTLQKQICTTNS
jgi:hypothetical protein